MLTLNINTLFRFFMIFAFVEIATIGCTQHNTSNRNFMGSSSASTTSIPPVVLTQSAFQATLYQYVTTNNCTNCHANGPTLAVHWFASPTLATAFQAAIALVDPTNVSASPFVTQVANDHCGFPAICQVSSAPIIAALNAWVAQSSLTCSFGGKIVNSGTANLSGYTSATVPAGSACQAITNISCNNGVILPALASPTCTVLGAQAYGSTFVPANQAVLLRLNLGLNPAGSTFPFPYNCQAGNNSPNCQSVWKNSAQYNLPFVSNPQSTNGEDQFSLLAFAGCNDIKAATFGVNTAGTVASQKANLIAAGVSMVNNHMGGLASTAAFSSQVSTVFANLIADPSYASATTQQIFVGICTAANTFGIGMRGF